MKSGNESEDWRTVRERPSGAMDMQDWLDGQCSTRRETAEAGALATLEFIFLPMPLSSV